MRARTFLLWGLLLALPASIPSAPASAQEPSPSHLAAARELVVAAGASGGIDQIIPALVAEVRRQTLTRPELTKDLDEVLKALAPEFEQQRQQALTIAARVYARFIPEAEIKEAVAFFRTPAGLRYVKAQPEITDEVVNNLTTWSQLAAEYVQTRVRAEMLKRGHQLQ